MCNLIKFPFHEYISCTIYIVALSGSHKQTSVFSKLLYWLSVIGLRYEICNQCSMLSCVSNPTKNPTKRDWYNLLYLYGYVKGTINTVLHLNTTAPMNTVRISADSAYGVHENDLHKSHTGYIIYIGGSPAHATSIKQNIVCDSSSYAELVALHSSIPPGAFIKSILEFIGITTVQLIIEQDNTKSIRYSYDTTKTNNHKYLFRY